MVPDKVITNFYNLSNDLFKYFVITIFYLHTLPFFIRYTGSVTSDKRNFDIMRLG